MRKLAVSLLIGLAAVLTFGACSSSAVLPYPWSMTWTCSAGTCTGSNPVIADAGASMAYVDGFRLVVCAADGGVLMGAGSMLAVLGDSISGQPARNSGLDQTVSVNAIGCATFPDFKVGYVTPEPDHVLFVPSGITVSDAGTLTEYIYPHRGQ